MDLSVRATNTGLQTIIGTSAIAESMRQFARKASRTRKTVLLLGETGSGKDHLAKHIGELQEENAPFFQIDCGVLPADLMETELFGHITGAFTGAVRNKKGLVEMAHGGTLFLNEIGNLPVELQSKLLRFLEERTFRKVGSVEDEKVDVRVIAGTNENLQERVAKKEMRSDLYYRMSTIEFTVRPLRERPEDIAPLANHFLTLEQSSRRFSSGALALMMAYPWPGNVRELRAFVDKMLFHSETDGSFTPKETAQLLGSVPETATEVVDILPEDPIGSVVGKLLEQQQRRDGRFPTLNEWQGHLLKSYFLKLFSETGGNIVRAAELAETPRSNIYKYIAKFGLRSRVGRNKWKVQDP